ncbi:zinc ribbon domain-containing protein [Roseimaritima sediminicola]|uniref:zinc ribbon domain-containing protein n=1 Tax=Roseimaritima sediminicola TaxID=2662066 RepID=UPI0012983881|nr:phospholipase [Roseimaritima sediminicola]
MSDASGSAELLRTLHRLHRQINDLQGQLNRGPRQQKAGEAAVLASQQALEDAESTLKQARMASDEKQLQLKSREQRVSDTQAKLNTAASNREFDALKEQIAADQQANDVLSDEILESLEQLDHLQEVVAQRQAELKQKKQDLEGLEKQIAARQAKLEPELQRVRGELEEAEESLPDNMRQDYQRVITARGEDGLAPVEGDSCGNCYQKLTPQVMNQLYLSHYVTCPACGAWIYLAEDRRVQK